MQLTEILPLDMKPLVAFLFNAILPARLAPVTPSDTDVFGAPTSGIHLYVGGAVTLLAVGNAAPVTVKLTAGWHPLQVTRIYATGTDTGLDISRAW